MIATMISRNARRRLIRMGKRVLHKWLGTGYIEGLKGGSFNNFVKLSENWGLKFATNKKQVLANYRRQRRASRLGLGPACFGLINCDNEVWGYITQVVTVVSDTHIKFERNPESIPEISKKVFRLVKQLEDKISFEFNDTKTNNLGFMGSNLVCIDFDVY